ncbi:hypothetical protein ES703_98897 [subsurface metagenome]
MEAVIQQGLGQVQGLCAPLLLAAAGEDELVHDAFAVGQVESRPEASGLGIGKERFQVVGVEDGPAGDIPQPFLAQAEDIGIGLHQHGEVAIKGVHAANAVLTVVIQLIGAVGKPLNQRLGQESHQVLHHTDGSGAGAAPAMRGGEGLVQVDMGYVEAHVHRAGQAHESVEVGPVHVHDAINAVDEPGDGGDLVFEQPQGVGLGEHHARHFSAELALQVSKIHPSPGVGDHLQRLVAGHDHAGGIGAVGRVGDNHILAAGPPGLMILTHNEHTHQLPLGARRRLEGEPTHAGDLYQGLLEPVHQSQGTLAARFQLPGMQSAESGQLRHGVIHLGVVLHGAAAQGIEVLVHVVVPGGQSDEVAHHLRLGDFRQLGRGLAQQVGGQYVGGFGWRDIGLRQVYSHPSRHGAVEDEQGFATHRIY